MMISVDRSKALFHPDSVAVVGASRSSSKLGNLVVANLQAAGYKGKIFPVNPAGGTIRDLPVFTSCADLPRPPDLGVICLPRDKVLDAMRELADAHVGAIAVLSAGFRETGRDGLALELKMAEMAARYNFTLLGPNSLGIIDASSGLNASIAQDAPMPGNIGFFSQSGALCASVLDWSLENGIGFSRFLSLGNKAGITEADALETLGDDPATSVIIGYLESLDNGRDFMNAAARVTGHKPVIMIKAGVTQAGARAVSSHTGAVAGSEAACTAAFKQSGIIVADGLDSLFDLARAFSTQPLPKGPNLTVVTNSGGPGILAADACENSDLELPRPSDATLEKLREALPSYAALYNPIDIIGDAGADRYKAALEAVAEDPATHSVLALLTPTASAEIMETAQIIAEVSKNSDKPFFACLMGDEKVGPGRDFLLESGIPCYAYPEPAVAAADAMYTQWRWQTRQYPVEICFRRDRGKAEKVFKSMRDIGLSEISGPQAFDVAYAYELPVPETKLARTADQAVKHAKKIGYPVVLKLVAEGVGDISEFGGVRLALHTPDDVRQAFFDITSATTRNRPDAHVSGCFVQSMGPENAPECTVRIKQDPQFGPLLEFGMSGPSAEFLGDRAYRIAPLTVQEAQAVIREIRLFPLLQGARGKKAADLKALEDIVLTMSQFANDFPEVLEAELDPVIAGPEGALVTGIRVVLGEPCQPRD
ncbi:acetate--CoA ligase family protein [Desulfovibrio oxyclinae]|jgi:acetyltransferase|uniref:acetate--CoA ligase family protein n=1 Tax=Desulfovibrio oxyclinae TaxID=63560 RepID=UPI000374935D